MDSIMRMSLLRFTYSGILLAAATAGSLLTPLSLHALLLRLDTKATDKEIYSWALILGLCSVASALTLHKFWWESSRIGLHSQLLQSTQVLVHTLGLSTAARGKLGSGRLLNAMAIDSCRLNDTYVFPFLHWNTWCAAATIAVCVVNVYWLLGAAGLIGCSAMFILLPASTLISRGSKRFSERVQARRDERSRLIGDALAGIQTLKALTGWVEWFGDRIGSARRAEMFAMQQKQLLSVAADFMGVALPVLVLALTLGLYSVLQPGVPLTAAVAFAAASWISNLQQPLKSMPATITSFVDASISLRRLRELGEAAPADVSGLSSWATWIRGLQRGSVGCDVAHSVDGAAGEGEHTALRISATGGHGSSDAVLMRGWLPVEALPEGDACDGDASESRGAWEAPTRMLETPGLGTVQSDQQAPIEVCDASFGWPADASAEAGAADANQAKDSSAAALRNVSFTCPRGTLTFIAGRIGSGKSTLLSGLICEAERLSGSATVTGSVAYAGQTPWILNRSLRENITFVSDYAPGRYDTVVRACALDVDAACFTHGHDELIGDNGITLSGGQKARVALARALYADSDVVILDDVLSALDAVVGEHVWREALVGLLLRRGKTVLVASHALHHASRPEVAQVVLLAGDGTVAGVGTLAEVAHLQPDLMRAPQPVTGPTQDTDALEEPLIGAGSMPSTAAATTQSVSPSAADLSSPEGYASGAVKAGHLWSYVRAMGSSLFLTLLLSLYLLAQASTIVSSWWLVQWTESGVGGDARFYASVYAGISGAAALLSLARMAALSVGAVRASTALHDAAIRGVLHAPASFFALNPAGRIQNRFVADVGTIDNTARSSVSALALQVLSLVGVLVVIGLTVPWVLLIVAGLAALYYDLARKYRAAARDLRRLQSTAKSPILSHFNETLRGIAVIRAYGPRAATAVVARHVELSRTYARLWLAYWSANEFISTALELLGSIVIFGVVFLCVWEHRRGALSTGQVGFALSFCLQLPSTFMWLTRQVSLCETDAVAIERLAEYAALPHEEEELRGASTAPIVGTLATSPSPPLPLPPALEMEGLHMRYGPNLPWVLRGANLTIPAGAKVAVIGRTGAGKSSLLQAVLRMYPHQRGVLRVGGVDAATTTCADLRSRVTPLLQDGALFTGSIRENLLGPRAGTILATHSAGARQSLGSVVPDAAVWRTLQHLGVEAAILSLPHQLDEIVKEGGGGGFSAGERALLCLARALLTRAGAVDPPQLLVVDEPTASVDPVADAAVHDALLSAPCAVLCICHRLQYLRRFDLVAVVDAGQVVEIGPPETMLAAEAGATRSSHLNRLLRQASAEGHAH